VERSFQDLAHVQGAGERQIFLKLILPAAPPWIIIGLKMSLPFALIEAIIGEFMAASKGLESGGIAVIFILMLLLIAFNALLNRLEDHLLRWRPKTPVGGEATEDHWAGIPGPRRRWG